MLGRHKRALNLSLIIQLMDTSDSHLKTGLQIIGKQYLNSREWTGKFADQQYHHQYPKDEPVRSKYVAAINNNLKTFKLHVETCRLCLSEKEKSEFHRLTKCSHTYCYSCLNSYAISRIEDSVPVVCPHQECGQIMPLSSKIYRFLPDNIKMKYLQNKSIFRLREKGQPRVNAQELCQRCFEYKHLGECKYAFAPSTIENSFKYRECPTCKCEIKMTEGKRKIKCEKCSQYLCYLCGERWEGKSHTCSQRSKVKELEQQAKDSQCCACSNSCDCSCGECDCCTCDFCVDCNDDFCCEILFYCGACSVGCIIWNLISIPVRLILSVLVLGFMSMMGGMLVILGFGMWLFVSVLGAICPVPMEMICSDDLPCFLRFLMVVFYPVTVLVSLVIALKLSSHIPLEIFGSFFSTYCEMLVAIWVEQSPKNCLS